MNRHQEVDVEKAVQAGASDGGITGGEGEDEGDKADSRLVAQELLLSLPGITVHNFRSVMAEVENIAELSTMTETKLGKLLGQANGKKLFEFFREKLPST
jgi:ERCC4-type nuclease